MRLLLLVLVGCAQVAEEVDPLATDGLVVTPAAVARGTTATVRIDAPEALFEPGSTLDLGAGVRVLDVWMDGFHGLVAEIAVDPDAVEGGRDVTIGAGDRQGVATGAFAVTTAGFSVSTARLPVGEVVSVALTGVDTSWNERDTWLDVGEGLRFIDWTVLSETAATARIAVEPDAELGLHEIVVQGGAAGLAPHAIVEVTPLEISAQLIPNQVNQGDASLAGFRLSGLEADGGTFEIVDDEVYGLRTWVGGGGAWMEAAWWTAPGPHDLIFTSGDRSAWMPRGVDVIDLPRELEALQVDIEFGIERELRSDGSYDESVSAEVGFWYWPSCTSHSDAPYEPPSYGSYDPAVYESSELPEQPDCPPEEMPDAGPELWFRSDTGEIRLDAEVNDGGFAYRAPALTLEDYAFGETYDLEVPGASGGVPAFSREGVVPTVPSDFTLTPPPARWSRADDLVVRWTPAGTYPDSRFIVRLRGTLASTGEAGFVGVAPWDNGEVTLPADLLGQLEAGVVTLEVLSRTTGPSFVLPGEFSYYQVRSTLRWQADFVLY